VQVVVEIEGLPHAALDAAAVFHAEHLQRARAALAGKVDALALVFPEAGHDHGPWRRAVVADLARAAAPKRVNAVAGSDSEAIAATLAWLGQADGITGQLLTVDGTGAGNPAQ
jgi:hypothetical protein